MNSPINHIDALLQCLSDNKRHLGFMIGAGCPFSIRIIEDETDQPLIPNIEGLTNFVLSEIKDTHPACETIVANLSKADEGNPTIEHILSYVRDLKNVVSKGAVLEHDYNCLEGLEEAICKAINKRVDRKLPNQSTPYHSLASWIGAAERDWPVELFTTNYDLLAEQALEEQQVPFFDGFPGSRQPFFDAFAIEHDSFSSRWARVWKLHGSINWRCTNSLRGMTVCRTMEETAGALTIHPSHMKYDQSRKMPYLAMMDRLKSFVKTPESALFMIGYSFGDEHLNDIIIEGLSGSPKSTAFALMFGKLSDQDVSTAVSIAKTQPNFTVFAQDGAVIGDQILVWKNVQKPPSSALPIEILEWTQSSDDSNIGTITFKLGDFNIFGKFLSSISGRER